MKMEHSEASSRVIIQGEEDDVDDTEIELLEDESSYDFSDMDEHEMTDRPKFQMLK